MCGVKLFYDHISVKRWLGGGVCQNPDVDTCDDGDRALALAEHSMSTMVTTRLRELITDTEPYRDMASVAEFRERLRTGLEG